MMGSSDPVLIAGAGLGGLLTACLVAKRGCAVRVFERAGHSGGRARSHSRDGYTMNLGAHALYLDGALNAVLGDLDIQVSGKVVDGSGGFGLYHGELTTLPAGPVSMLVTRLFSLPDKLAAGRLLASLPRLETRELRGLAMEQWIQSATPRPAVRDFLRAATRVSTYTAELEELDAGFALHQIQMASGSSVRYLDGGWQTMVDALEARARSLGVEIQYDCAVESLTEDGRGFVLAGGLAVAGRACVLATSPSHAAQLGVDLRDRVPVRAACLDVALRKLPNPRARFALGIDRPLYFSVHSEWAELAPTGGAVIQAARYLRSDDDGREMRPALESWMDRVQPGWREHVEHARFSPSLTVVHDIPGPGRERADTVAGRDLYLVGDWVGREGMLSDAAAHSARDVARAIVARDGTVSEDAA